MIHLTQICSLALKLRYFDTTDVWIAATLFVKLIVGEKYDYM